MIPPEAINPSYKLHERHQKRLRPSKSGPALASASRSSRPDPTAPSMPGYSGGGGDGGSSGNGSGHCNGNSNGGGGGGGGLSSLGGMPSRAFTPSPAPEDVAQQRDSHDLNVTNGGRGRDSLLDNLLLSFDKIGDGLGPFGPVSSSPYFSAVDEIDDDEDSLYSTDSRGYARRADGKPEYAGGSFGITYDTPTRSRGRGTESSHGYANGFDTYDSAPAPSIRTRNRTPSPPRSPRLVRRPSTKSIKSLRRDHQFHPPPDPASLPPLPAFAAPPAVPMAAPSKPANRPGFFRRVFGGGGGGSSAGSSSSNNSKPPPSSPPIAQQIESPQSVITKKPSFFRRRKKSVSDAHQHPPPPPLPVSTAAPEPPLPMEISSPASSLRDAMKPYIRSPGWNSTHETPTDDREPAYLARNATIRTVASSDRISPRRPSFFGDSPRNQQHRDTPEGGGRKYRKESWNARGSEEPVDPLPVLRQDHYRPQTSPNSPPIQQTFFKDKEDDESNWPPRPKRSILSKAKAANAGGHASEGDRSELAPDPEKDRKSSAASVASQPIINMKEYKRKQEEEEVQSRKDRRMQAGPPYLGLDTANIGPQKPVEQSWLTSATPPPPSVVGTPTVTIQGDGLDEPTELLDDDDDDDDDDNGDDDAPSSRQIKRREMAQKIFDGDEEFVSKARAAAWLGEEGEERTAIRRVYLELFDWAGVNILSAMRILCGRLVFKGETQQVDRIMTAFAHRWCQCNPNHGFKNPDIVHTIVYSLFLLNTDLHVADMNSSQRMTRGQFLKNTMATIRRAPAESTATDAADSKLVHSNTLPPRSQTPYEQDDGDNPPPNAISSVTFPMSKSHHTRPSLEFGREFRGGSRSSRLGNLSPRLPPEDSTERQDFDMDGGLALVHQSVGGGVRVWETQIEIILKDFYQSLKAVALPLHGASQEKVDLPHSSSLSVFGSGGMLRRSPSTISKAGSEMSVAARQRTDNSTKLNTKWGAKNRSRQRVYNGSFAGSSRTSLEDRSVWSPSASSTWSKYTLDKTQTSVSVDTLGSAFANGDYQSSIGFANALSHAIIREEVAPGHSGEESQPDILDGDGDLELEGAPWAKEGIVKHRHHLDAPDKKAKNRVWTECFAVVQRGYVRLFQFPNRSSGKSAAHFAGGVVGGGNWTENAEPIGNFVLRQTLSHALPPPGYSKTRPYVWALSLPSGAVHLFEAGTADIVREFVSTANYWAARTSKEPLIGAVSNIEYGWGDALLDRGAELPSSPPASVRSETITGRPSLQMSIRSSIDHSSKRPRLPGDKVLIKDWMPPAHSMVSSSLPEPGQLKALGTYVTNIEAELQQHNELRPLMQQAFTNRHPNYTKAMANWERKSSHLLHEIIKFRTYIETLQSAIGRRVEVRSQRAQAAITVPNDANPNIKTAPKPDKTPVS